MIERIEHLAHVTVARGCGFAALAILTFFIGMLGELATAFKCAGYLSMLACTVLLLKAGLARLQPYRRTELWLMLKPTERPPTAVAQQLIGTTLREVYLYFARQAAILSVMFLSCGLLIGSFQA
ncbi:MAG: hypothetical protein AB7L90_10900 [Hyphomicrobiaceae bacterium]